MNGQAPTQVRLANGTFELNLLGDGRWVGTLDAVTPIGRVRLTAELSAPRAATSTGAAPQPHPNPIFNWGGGDGGGPLPVPLPPTPMPPPGYQPPPAWGGGPCADQMVPLVRPGIPNMGLNGMRVGFPEFWFVAQALDYVVQNAVTSGVALEGNLTKEEKAAFETILAAELGHGPSQAKLRHLFTTMPDAPETKLMQSVGEKFQTEIPKLVAPLGRLRDHFRSGDYDTAKEKLRAFFTKKYGVHAPHGHPDAEYYTGGAPCKVGAWRTITGCDCPNPVSDCGCIDGVCPC